MSMMGHFHVNCAFQKASLENTIQAAIFEHSKEKKMIYFKSHKNSCLVEQDEEPPHTDKNMVSLKLNSTVPHTDVII